MAMMNERLSFRSGYVSKSFIIVCSYVVMFVDVGSYCLYLSTPAKWRSTKSSCYTNRMLCLRSVTLTDFPGGVSVPMYSKFVLKTKISLSNKLLSNTRSTIATEQDGANDDTQFCLLWLALGVNGCSGICLII